MAPCAFESAAVIAPIVSLCLYACCGSIGSFLSLRFEREVRIVFFERLEKLWIDAALHAMKQAAAPTFTGLMLRCLAALRREQRLSFHVTSPSCLSGLLCTAPDHRLHRRYRRSGSDTASPQGLKSQSTESRR